jgi:hypothetical protein
MSIRQHAEQESHRPSILETQSEFVSGIHRDPERWRRTDGWQPIQGGSGEAKRQPEIDDEEPRSDPPVTLPGPVSDQLEGHKRPDFGQGQSEQEPIPDTQDERLAKAIRDLEKGYDPSARFETQLMLEGLLDRLEEAKIVPIVENPNPYDPDVDEDKHERWWEEHREEAEDFERSVDRRSETLRHLYIGAIIGSGPWNLP